MISAPDYIQFYPTMRCNESCDFCFNIGMPQHGDMSLTDFKRMTGILKGIGTRTFDIMGGEPTLHRDLLRFIGHAHQEGMQLNISSNGSRPLVLNEIRDLYPDVAVGISVNDRKNLPARAALIAEKRLIVKTVVGLAPDAMLINELLSCGPAGLFLLYRDALEPEQLAKSPPFYEFLDRVQTYDPASVGTVFCSGFLPDLQRYPFLEKARCPAGTTKLGILPDGSVYPCNLFFRFPEFRLGNILTSPFEEIWGHPLLSFFRTFNGNACPQRDCELHAACHGGCPAHSYAHYGECSAPEPRCVRT